MRCTLIFALNLSLGLLAPALPAQQAPASESAGDVKGIPARTTAADYLSHTEIGPLTLAAEFTGHSIPTPQGPLTNADYVAVEVALYGPAGTRLKLSFENFSLRLNGKKVAISAEPFGVVLAGLKDPETEPPSNANKSKSKVGGTGQGESEPPPETVKIPVPVLRAMGQRVQKAALPEGERTLPQAGMVFFEYRSKTEKLKSIELIYDGPAGKGTLKLQQ